MSWSAESENKITAYEVITAERANEFNRQAQALIASGFTPVGSLIVRHPEMLAFSISQAFAKYAESAP